MSDSFFSSRWPLAIDALDAARWSSLQCGGLAEDLYFGFVADPAAPWPKDNAPGYLECLLEQSLRACEAECKPYLPALRQIHFPKGVQGWGRRQACGVDALLHFSRGCLSGRRNSGANKWRMRSESGDLRTFPLLKTATSPP